jgi:hypothetical protein
MLNVEDGANVRGAIAGKALIGPAEGVWRDNDIVEMKKRIGRIGRLLLKNIQSGPGNAPGSKDFRECFLIDDGPARRVDQVSGRFHQ